ncbi:MAG: S41 family peptidase [Wenzhouxiangellaceae bacterium]
MKPIVLAAGLLAVALTAPAHAENTLLLRQPALSADHLAFVYAGDLWIANRDGSEARRLTSHPADEHSPRFSPDGSQIAYAASYEDNQDVYIIAVDGGQPRRLTWHPADDLPIGWSADGAEVALVSPRETDHGRSAQLYHVAVSGGLPRLQMAARIYRGAYNADLTRLAYMDHGSGYNGLFGGSSGWKGYRGGTTPDIKVMDFAADSVTTIPGAGANNFNPLWLGERLYFLSDRDAKTANLFAYDADSQQVSKITAESDWDIRHVDGYGDTIVYEAGGRLKSLNLKDGSVQELAISITPDLPQLRPQWKDASQTIQHTALSTTGKRALITARGEVFTVPVDEGSTRNLTQSAGVREYFALWSPSGEQVAYIEESLDGQTLVLSDQTGSGDHRRLPLGPHYYQLLAWTPGERQRIVYQDNHLGLHVMDLQSGDSQRIATQVRRDAYEISISPDGAWLAYNLEQANYHRQLMLYRFADGDTFAVSENTADTAAPAFSRDGQYLYFAASTNSGPLQVGLDMSSQERPYRAGLYALVLSADGQSPLLPKPGDETAKDAETADDQKSDDKGGDKAAAETRIDVEGMAARIVGLPVAKSNYDSLVVAGDGKLYFIERAQPGSSDQPPGERSEQDNRLARFNFEERAVEPVLDNIVGLTISADGQHLLLQKPGGALATAKVQETIEAQALDLSALQLRIDPRQEWAQIFDETWRMELEHFYADNMHGLDWQAVYDKYRPLLDHVGRREDLNTLLVEMIAEMQVGHNRVRGGDVHQEESTATGLLGANLEIANNRYRFARVYTGELWNTFIKAPLATPGNAAFAGEYLLAVNGRELTADDNLFAWLQNTVGKQVSLRVGPNANGRDARDIVVEPVDDERELRLWAWIENNRRAVAEATDGRVGYIYLPNTAGAGYTFFNRMFFPQLDKEALIIDERSNGGGQAANYIAEVLSRQHLSGWMDREGLIFNTPAGAVHGPKVMLIDQDAGSGGDFLPYSFRHYGTGKLIGTRTWGGLIGISYNPDLIDGGRVSVPFFRFFNADGKWTIENEGVAPDIEVELDPIATNNGRDTQLERAIDEVMAQLEGYQSDIPQKAPALPTELGQ